MALRVRLRIASVFVVIVTFASCTSSSSSAHEDEGQSASSAAECQEPENPYDEGSGHYAGFDWAEKNGSASCGGNSQSFIEGCEEYQEQLEAFEECTSKKK